MNPWLLLGFAAALVASYLAGRHDGARIEEAAGAREERIAQVTRDAAQKGAASAIARIKVVHQIVTNQLEREIHEKPVYRDCRHDPVGLLRLNAAITGRSVAPGASLVPGIDPAAGPDIRRDDAEVGGSGGAVSPVP